MMLRCSHPKAAILDLQALHQSQYLLVIKFVLFYPTRLCQLPNDSNDKWHNMELNWQPCEHPQNAKCKQTSWANVLYVKLHFSQCWRIVIDMTPEPKFLVD